jgi:hypothetical protein
MHGGVNFLYPDFALSIAASRIDAVKIEVFIYQIGSIKNKENPTDAVGV